MSNSPLGLERRSGKTFSKHVKLTPFGRAKIERWALAHNVNFSTAIETLALIGLDDERAHYAIPALRDVAKQSLDLVFTQIGKTLSQIQQDATTGRLLTEVILLQWIRSEAAAHGDDFAAIMGVSRTSQREIDQRIRQFHEEIKDKVAAEAGRRNHHVLRALQAVFTETEANDDAS